MTDAAEVGARTGWEPRCVPSSRRLARILVLELVR